MANQGFFVFGVNFKRVLLGLGMQKLVVIFPIIFYLQSQLELFTPDLAHWAIG